MNEKAVDDFKQYLAGKMLVQEHDLASWEDQGDARTPGHVYGWQPPQQGGQALTIHICPTILNEHVRYLNGEGTDKDARKQGAIYLGVVQMIITGAMVGIAAGNNAGDAVKGSIQSLKTKLSGLMDSYEKQTFELLANC